MNPLKIPDSSDREASGAQQTWADEGGQTSGTTLPLHPPIRVAIQDIDKIEGLQERPTMETLVGVENGRRAGAPIELLGRLRFAGNHLTLAHVGAIITPPMMTMMPMPGTYPYGGYTEVEAGIDAHGSRMLREAYSFVKADGLEEGLREVNTVGGAASTLISLADEGHVQLIAIGSSHQGILRSFLLGSVGRALAIGAHESFLIARQEIKSPGPIRAVFATDHSRYANEAFTQLLEMNPIGLGDLIVTTVMEAGIERRMSNLEWMEGDTPYTHEQALDAVHKLGAAMVERIRATGRRGRFVLETGEPIDVLRRTMEETEADLMILGARGHGLVERALVGSLALHMVVGEPCSLLVVRVPEGD